MKVISKTECIICKKTYEDHDIITDKQNKKTNVCWSCYREKQIREIKEENDRKRREMATSLEPLSLVKIRMLSKTELISTILIREISYRNVVVELQEKIIENIKNDFNAKKSISLALRVKEQDRIINSLRSRIYYYDNGIPVSEDVPPIEVYDLEDEPNDKGQNTVPGNG